MTTQLLRYNEGCKGRTTSLSPIFLHHPPGSSCPSVSLQPFKLIILFGFTHPTRSQSRRLWNNLPSETMISSCFIIVFTGKLWNGTVSTLQLDVASITHSCIRVHSLPSLRTAPCSTGPLSPHLGNTELSGSLNLLSMYCDSLAVLYFHVICSA